MLGVLSLGGAGPAREGPRTNAPRAVAQILARRPGQGRGLQTFKSLGHRDFRVLWVGVLISASGQWMEQVAQGWLILQLTDSPFMVAAGQGARALPSLVISPLAGVVADRVDRKRLICASQLVSCALAATMAALALSGTIRVWQIFVLVALFGATWSFNNPARQALIPNLVPKRDLMNAMAVSSTAFNVSRIFGPALAGILISTVDVGGAFALASVLYALVFITTLFVRAPRQTSSTTGTPFLSNIVAAVAYLRANRPIMLLVAMTFIPVVLGMPFMALMPVFVRDVLHRDAGALSILYIFAGMGSLVATLVLATLGNYGGAGKIVLMVGVIFGGSIVAFSLVDSYVLALLIVTVMGGSQMMYMAVTNTTIQMMVDDAMRGRVMSLLMMEFGLSPLGGLIMGVLAELLSPQIAGIIMGSILTAVLFVALLTFKTIRQLDPAARATAKG